MIVREANINDLNEILQLYLYLHEESILDDTEHLRNTWKSIISDANHKTFLGCSGQACDQICNRTGRVADSFRGNRYGAAIV